MLKNKEYQAGAYEKALEETFLRIDELLQTPTGLKEIAQLQRETLEQEDKTKPKNPLSMMGEDGPDGRGCTSNVLLIKSKVMYAANAGDSRAVLATKGLAINLTQDHKPENEKELARITKAGGTVTNGRIEGNLNLSRALGDLRYKKNTGLKPEEQMISAAPDVTRQPVSKDFDFVVMGCDGIYDSLTSEKIVEFVYKSMKEKPDAKLSAHVERLMDTLLSPDYMKTEGTGCDNMTCILIKFNHA